MIFYLCGVMVLPKIIKQGSYRVAVAVTRATKESQSTQIDTGVSRTLVLDATVARRLQELLH